MAARVIISMKMFGDEELERAFKTLEGKEQKSVMRTAMRKAARPIKDKAISLVPRMTGVNTDPLRAGIAIKPLKRAQLKRGNLGVQIVTPTREELGIPASYKGYYPAHIELGTTKTPPHRFFRDAMAMTRKSAMTIATREIRRGILRIWAKRAKKAV